ncbi:MAG TPA: NADH-quinone oxidoreductase subunit C [Chryseosolibacter sp.]
MLAFEELFQLVKQHCANGEPTVDESSTPKAIRLSVADLVNVCHQLQRDEKTFFDMLSCVTAIDNGPEAKTMEVVYNLYSIPFNHHVALKVSLPRENPEIATVSHIWKTADWHEREAFDMFGIKFTNHPDLRRILMPADWEGHPLRKDYKQQEYYRDIKLDY